MGALEVAIAIALTAAAYAAVGELRIYVLRERRELRERYIATLEDAVISWRNIACGIREDAAAASQRPVTLSPPAPRTFTQYLEIDDAALNDLVAAAAVALGDSGAAAAAPVVTESQRVDHENCSRTPQYVVLQVRRDEVLDQLRAWSAQAEVLLPLIPTTPTAANQLNTLVIELQALIHRLDGKPVGERMEPPATPEAREPGSAAVETTMPATQTERAIDEEEDVDVDLDIPDDADEDFDEADDDFEDEDDFDEDDFDEDSDDDDEDDFDEDDE
jgi:hypothetical protein